MYFCLMICMLLVSWLYIQFVLRALLSFVLSASYA